jgi:hypothetical protein
MVAESRTLQEAFLAALGSALIGFSGSRRVDCVHVYLMLSMHVGLVCLHFNVAHVCVFHLNNELVAF